MKGIFLTRYGNADEAFEMREVPAPEPAPGQVRISVEAFGLNFADVAARRGLYQDAPPLPALLGYEVVGRIDCVGPGVDASRIGQRVVALTRFGGYATSAVTDARAAVPIPEEMDAGAATALATQYGTAWFCAEEMVRLHTGDHVLVHAAAGGVGTALVQLCKRRGCVVYGTASSQKMDYLRRIGVDWPIDYVRADFAAVLRMLRGNDGLDVIFDSIGGKAVRQGVALLAAGGRIVCLGAAAHEPHRLQLLSSLRFAASFGFQHPIRLMLASKAIIGVNMLRIADHKPAVLQRCLEAVVDLTRKGEIEPMVGGRYPVDRIGAAHAFLEGRGSTGKVVVTWT